MRRIAARIVTAQTRGMTVDDAPMLPRDAQFLHHDGIFVKDAGEVHHLAEIAHTFVGEQRADIVGRDLRTGRLERRGRNAGRRTEGDGKGHTCSVVQHVADTFHAVDVADLVRIAHRGHGTVDDGETGEFGRYEHRRFDVDVGIDEAGQDRT